MFKGAVLLLACFYLGWALVQAEGKRAERQEVRCEKDQLWYDREFILIVGEYAE